MISPAFSAGLNLRQTQNDINNLRDRAGGGALFADPRLDELAWLMASKLSSAPRKPLPNNWLMDNL
ncbi:MAG: hypothetical protein R3261_11630, partial [Alphaproteobacteria bacterium]|nr:hypothetical protein [Alphaproteobacteria bacterium]